jgi:hypothetical protein
MTTFKRISITAVAILPVGAASVMPQTTTAPLRQMIDHFKVDVNDWHQEMAVIRLG